MARRSLRNLDWPLVLAVFALLGVGLLLVYSASHVPALPGRSGLFARQLSWLGVGLVVLLLAAALPFRLWEEYSHFLFAAALVLLLAVPVFGVERLGAKRWLSFGGFQFQPSELAKIATLLLVARLLARPRFDVRRWGHVLPVAAVAGGVFLLILVEPDLGTSLSIPAAVVPMLFWAGLPIGVILVLVSPLLSAVLSLNLWVWLLFLGAVAFALSASRARRNIVVGVLALNMAVGAATPILWNSLKPYQQQRVITFLNPDHDRVGAGYQVIQSKIAIGSGGLAGKGFLDGTQKGLAFLPQQHTDFIFSVLGEEFGFLGCLLVLLLYALLVQRILLLATRARSRFGGILIVGIGGILVFHVAVNVSMTLGLAPVTGLPLPFLSYGGTFLVTVLFLCGLLINVSLRRNEV
jgi:rod shape determining protein RodA